MATAPAAVYSTTVRGAADTLGSAPVAASAVVEAIRERHTSDYGGAQLSVPWPSGTRLASAEEWLAEARRMINPAQPTLHGRAALVGLALADAPTGRAMVESGLFHAIAAQVRGGLAESLSPQGLRNLTAIPMAGAIARVAVGASSMPGRVQSVAFSPRGRLLAVAGDFGLRLLTRVARREVRAITGPLTHAVFSPDGDRLALGGRGGVETVAVAGGSPATTAQRTAPRALAWPAGSPEPVAVTTHGVDVRTVTAVATARDAARVALGTQDGEFRVLDAETGQEIVRNAVNGKVAAVALGPGGAQLAIADGAGLVQVWSVDSGMPVWSDSVPGGARRLAFSRDGRRLAGAAEGGTLRLWDGSGKPRPLAAGHGGNVQAVAFDPTGRYLATAGDDATARIWNVQTGAEVARLPHSAAVTCIDWAPDGSQLLTGAGNTIAVWSASLEPPLRRPLTGYDPDDVSAADDLDTPLAVDADVDALGALISARTVTPPLSIGLFGDWGSGKTFFMRRLRARVDRIAQDARESGELQRDIAFHKRIAQIDFNAWHYAEGNLWASLVEHILSHLRVAPDEPADRVEQRKRLVLEELRKQRGVAETARARVAAGDSALKAAQTRQQELAEDVAKLRGRDALATPAGKDVAATVQAALTAAGVPAAGTTVRDLSDALTAGRAALASGRTLLARAPGAGRRFGWLVTILVIAPAAAVAVGWLLATLAPDVVAAIGAAATAAAGLGAPGAAWLRNQARWTADRLAELDAAERALQEPIERARLAQEQEVARKRAEYDAALQASAAEEARLRALEADLAATTPARMLAQLVADRVDSDDYRRHLGVLALVRRDFEAISEYLRLQADALERCETLSDEQAQGDVSVGRIVLYIDDLDRCRPRQVVEVLQAVHLLLAFPLFVVVVGVDVRWVEHSLALEHENVLDAGGARPRDYLEKIFQIPFWLPPLGNEGSRYMLSTLLGPAQEPEAAVEAPGDSVDAAAGDGAGEPPLAAQDGSPPAAAAPVTPVPAPPRDLQPQALDITGPERRELDELAPLLGRSPRALKRCLNTYRLIKVRVDDLDAFLDEDAAHYRSVLLLLALCTGTPTFAAALLDELVTGPSRPTIGALVAALEDTPPDEAARLRRWEPVSLAQLKPWAAEVGRFTFHLAG